MPEGVVFELVKGGLGFWNVPGAHNKVVGLGLLEQLFNHFEALLDVSRAVELISEAGLRHTRPDEVPVAITLFAVADMIGRIDIS